MPDGKKIRKGGIAIMWNNNIKYAVTVLDNIGDNRFQMIMINIKGKKTLYIMNVYMPSVNHTITEYEAVLNDIMDVYSYYTTKGIVILAGDFNTSLGIGQRAYPRPLGDQRRVNALEHFILSSNLVSLVTHRICKGPVCTYFPYSGAPGTQIDHYLI